MVGSGDSAPCGRRGNDVTIPLNHVSRYSTVMRCPIGSHFHIVKSSSDVVVIGSCHEPQLGIVLDNVLYQILAGLPGLYMLTSNSFFTGLLDVLHDPRGMEMKNLA